MKVKPTKEQFKAYLVVQHAGLCNMFDTRYIIQNSRYELTKDIIFYIYDHYEELVNEYKISVDDITDEDLESYGLDRLFE